MLILQKDESMKNNSPPKDKLLSKGENTNEILFFPKEKTEKIPINPIIILSDMEKGYLAFSKFIYNNPNGKGFYHTSIESIYPQIMITDQTYPILIQNSIDYDFVD